MLQDGTILDNKYRIEGTLGRGGFGYVYRARERVTGEIVAIKELVPSFVDNPEMVQRFIQEARATLHLTHSYIARTYGIFQDGGTYYLAMEYLPGGSLADRLRGGALPLDEAAEIVSDLCAALAYAHEKGVVHNDIKPANVLFDGQGEVRLADFGIAHVSEQMMTRHVYTATGTAMGTVQYMAPEQLEGVRDDPRIDIYAVGALLYESLAGRPYLSFDTESTPAAQVRNVQRIQEEPPLPLRDVNPTVPDGVAKVVERALRKSPDERFDTASAMRQALQSQTLSGAPMPPLQGATGGDRAAARKASWLQDLPMWSWIVGAAGLLAIFVVGVMLILASQRDTSTVAQPTGAPADEVADAPTTAVPATAAPTEPTSTLEPTSTTAPVAAVAVTETPLPTPTPTSEASPTVTPSATSRPTETPTSTPAPDLRPAYQPIPLGPVANGSNATDFESPPTGTVTLGGVPFQLSEQIFKSQASSAPNDGYPTRALVSTDVRRAFRVHLLVTTGNGFSAFRDRVVGRVLATCDGSQAHVADLRLGRDVREWHAAQNVVATASGVQQVWSGAIAGFPDLEGHIDMLSLDLPSACRSGRLTALEVVDSSADTVQSLDPALNLTGVTVEYYR